MAVNTITPLASALVPWTDIGMFCVNIGLLVFAAITVCLGFRQSAKHHEANKTAKLIAGMQLANTIIDSHTAWLDAKAVLEQLTYSSNTDTLKDLQSARFQENIKLTEYLKSLNGLCGYIRRGDINEVQYQVDYRQTIFEAVNKHPSMFGINSPYIHIKKVYEAWYDGESARQDKNRLVRN